LSWLDARSPAIEKYAGFGGAPRWNLGSQSRL